MKAPIVFPVRYWPPRPRPLDRRQRLHVHIALAKPDPCGTLLYRPNSLLAGNLVAPKKGRIARWFYRLRQTIKWYGRAK